MAWTKALPASELPSGEAAQVDIDGQQYLLCRDDTGVYALDNECPHAGAPLAMGNFSSPLIVCPWHAWEFDCRTGACVHSSHAKLRTYPAELREAEVWIDVPEAG